MRQAIREGEVAGDDAGRGHGFQIRVEEQRLKVAFVRSWELQRGELQAETSQRLLMIQIDQGAPRACATPA